MRLVVIRHAQAVPPGTGTLRDADRPLTADGERRFAAFVPFIARIVPNPDVLLTSPLVRAQQTAALLARAWGGMTPTVEHALASGSVDAIMRALSLQPRDATVVMVGHEPTVSALLCEALGVISSEAIGFEPGAAALIDLPSMTRAGARLVWFVPPAVTQ